DAEGRFAFEHLGPGPHVVHAQAHEDSSVFAGHEGATPDVRGGDVAVRVVVGAGLSVFVELVDATTGEPVSASNFKASLQSPTDPNLGSRTSFGGDDVRTIRMSMKVAGPADLTIDVPGYETFGPERVEIAAHEERRIVARLRRKS
ncbi:MAG: hypothetical protein K8T90_22250, partial [Planctomycetes bacterium]|nr:hypothetical protein [Planctomycetota bacterium]